MARVASGDAAGQRAVVTRLLVRVGRLCRAVLRHREDAEDATQMSMLEILKSAGSYRGESSLERWADRITVRTALRSIQTERRAHRAPVAHDDVSIDDGAGEAGLLARQYLDRISERQRVVLVLRHGLDLSIDDISELIGISPNSVKDRLLRGRAAIRQMMRREQFQLDVATGEAET